MEPDPSEMGGTMRELFAGQALAGVMLNRWYQDRDSTQTWESLAAGVAEDCYDIADAMIAERKKRLAEREKKS